MHETQTQTPVYLLLVEDNHADIRLMQENLKAIQIHTQLEVVTDGDPALCFLRRQAPYADAVRPDFILLDLHLPRTSGFVVLRELEQDPGLRDIPSGGLSRLGCRHRASSRVPLAGRVSLYQRL